MRSLAWVALGCLALLPGCAFVAGFLRGASGAVAAPTGDAPDPMGEIGVAAGAAVASAWPVVSVVASVIGVQTLGTRSGRQTLGRKVLGRSGGWRGTLHGLAEIVMGCTKPVEKPAPRAPREPWPSDVERRADSPAAKSEIA